MNILSEWRNKPIIAQLFDTLFLIISIATFRHTAMGFASIEGSVVAGGLSAIAIDVTMYLAALSLNSNLTWRGRFAVGSALLLSALASAVAQLLFSITHAEVLTVAAAAEWLPWAQTIIDYRVVWMPFSLPVFALLVTAAGKAQESEGVSLVAYRELQSVARDRELELDELEARLQIDIDGLNEQLNQVRANVNRGDELQTWVDELQSIGINTRQQVVATLSRLHNGRTGTQKEFARLLDISPGTVREGQALLKDTSGEQ